MVFAAGLSPLQRNGSIPEHPLGPETVSGDVDNPLFGHAINASPPRLMQLALKFTF
jgi:hypothetical protein